MNSPQPSSDLQQFVDSINKTGFVLENRVVSILRKHGWAVLNNRHYVDDTSAVVREIDIIAYKTAKLEFITVYTSLVLSCKKSEGNSWALLSRDLPAADVNRNRQPLHAWSNDVPISYMLAADEFAPNFYSTTCVAGTGPLFRPKDYELFAFQEMAESSGAVRNDKAIYQAVTSLMKAQAYEVQSLPRRKKTPSVYQFNLVSVLDGQMVRLHFDELAVTANRTHDEIHCAQYIVNGATTDANVRFMTAQSFEDNLVEYDALHVSNLALFKSSRESFYFRIELDGKRLAVFLNEFRTDVCWAIDTCLRKMKRPPTKLEEICLEWQTQKQLLQVSLFADVDSITALNSDEFAKRVVASSLKKRYKFAGRFEFSDDIPF